MTFRAGRGRKAFMRVLGVLVAIACLSGTLLDVPARAADLAELYTSRAITTGTGEKNRKLGFRDCLDRSWSAFPATRAWSRSPRSRRCAPGAAISSRHFPISTGWPGGRSMTSRAPMTGRTT
jgi:hypothetical protein